MKKQLKQFVNTINLLIMGMAFALICTLVFSSLGTYDMHRTGLTISQGK